jgi:hypothetical protein
MTDKPIHGLTKQAMGHHLVSLCEMQKVEQAEMQRRPRRIHGGKCSIDAQAHVILVQYGHGAQRKLMRNTEA